MKEKATNRLPRIVQQSKVGDFLDVRAKQSLDGRVKDTPLVGLIEQCRDGREEGGGACRSTSSVGIDGEAKEERSRTFPDPDVRMAQEPGKLADEFPDLALREEPALGEDGEGGKDLDDDELLRICT